MKRNFGEYVIPSILGISASVLPEDSIITCIFFSPGAIMDLQSAQPAQLVLQSFTDVVTM